MTLPARAVVSTPPPVILSPSTGSRTSSAKNLGMAQPGFASLSVCSAWFERRGGGAPPHAPAPPPAHAGGGRGGRAGGGGDSAGPDGAVGGVPRLQVGGVLPARAGRRDAPLLSARRAATRPPAAPPTRWRAAR